MLVKVAPWEASESYYYKNGTSNGRPVWINKANTSAFWHDGHTEASSDWMFGDRKNLGSTFESKAHMFTDVEVPCPNNQSVWKTNEAPPPTLTTARPVLLASTPSIPNNLGKTSITASITCSK